MGLDVYLERCANKEEASRLEKEYEDRTEKVWACYDGYDNMTDFEKDEARETCEAIADELGLSKWGENPARESVKLPSEIDPEHYFKVGYFRSSYNSGGINSVMGRAGLPTLYDIFEPNDEYRFTPDWLAALARTNDAIGKFEHYMNSVEGKYDAMDAKMRVYEATLPTNGKEALDIFFEELERETTFKSYSGQRGTFYLDGLKCYGFIPGKDVLGSDCMYVVYDSQDLDWYLTALRIVKETIQYVLDQDDTENYYLLWSS